MKKVLRLIKAPHVFYGWNKTLALRTDKLEEAWIERGSKIPLTTAEINAREETSVNVEEPPPERPRRKRRAKRTSAPESVSNADLIAGLGNEPTADP